MRMEARMTTAARLAPVALLAFLATGCLVEIHTASASEVDAAFARMRKGKR